MSDRAVLNNWRRFPRARLSCEVVYGDRLQSWHSHTRDISLGGCRVAGYYPFPLGKSLALKIAHSSMPEPVAVVGKVAQLYGGADNAVGLVFDRGWRDIAKFEEWMRKVIASNPIAERMISQMPDHLPIEARLLRAPRRQVERPLSPGEIALMQKLDRCARPVPLMELRTEWGQDWERKAQAAFDLIAEGIILCSMPSQPTTSSSTVQEFAVDGFFSSQLIKDLQSEYGPLDKGFARELETITQEVNGTGVDQAVKISWVSTKRHLH